MKSLVRWGGTPGLAQVAIRAGARSGDLHARLINDPAARADPYPLYEEFRSRGPLVAGRFAYVSARHEVVAEILRHPDFRIGLPADAAPRPVARALAWARDPSVAGPAEPPSMLAVDGAQHTRLRRLVSKAFTARAVELLHADVEQIAQDLLDRLDGSGPIDLIESYAGALPVQVIAGVLGVPVSMQQTFLRWGKDLTPKLDVEVSYGTFRRSEASLRELNGWLLTHFARLRAQPGDDLLSRVILAGRADDEPEPTDAELAAVAGLVLTAGFETTANLIGNAVLMLLGQPEQLEELLGDPAGWANAVEEVLRLEAPVQNTARHPIRDVTVHGTLLPRNQLVALLLGGANRDPAVFAAPDRLDVRRANAREHLAFSTGSHYCLGAALARAEGEIGLRLLFDRHPGLTLAGNPVRRPTRVLRGWASIPVRLHAPLRTG